MIRNELNHFLQTDFLDSSAGPNDGEMGAVWFMHVTLNKDATKCTTCNNRHDQMRHVRNTDGIPVTTYISGR